MSVLDDDTPRRYLLGMLSPEEEEAFEGRFATDDALFDEVEATEEDLIDAYARGQLEAGERTLVEGRLLASPEQQRRLAFARALADAAARAGSTRRPAPRRPVPVGLQWAAVLLIATTGGLLAAREIRTANGALAAAQVREDAAHRQIQALQTQVASLERAAPSPRGDTPRWTLRAGWERGTGPEPGLVLGSAEWVRLDLVLEEPPASEDRFRLRIETPEGRVVTMQDGLSAVRMGEGPLVAALVPAQLLEDGTYLVGLSSLRGGARTEVGTYRLRVVHRR